MWRMGTALAVLFTASLAHSQDALTLIGQRVVIKYNEPLRIGEVVVKSKEYRAFTVERADGDWLWLVSGGIAGWAKQDEVLPLSEAVDFYTEEIKKSPDSWNAYLYRGFVWDAKHEYDKAIADYTAAIKIYPMWPYTFNNRGWTWHRKKKLDKAIADYNAALRLDPKCVLAIANRGLAWQEKGEYYKALADYSRAVQVDPKYARGYVARAWLYATCPDRKFRDGRLAIESATRACELSQWREADKLGVLAAAYAEEGDFDKAVRWQEQANKRYNDPEDRKKGEERLELYQQKKPYRMDRQVDPAGH
jgi:tetratricopeptide (TPR) repeat protein